MLSSSHLYREIQEQPAAIEAILTNEKDTIQKLAAEIKAREITHVIIAARGTSDNAGRYAKYVLGAKNRLPVALATPSLFSIYNAPPKFGKALVLGISQSGKSPDIVSVLTEAKKQGVLTAAMTNNTDSPMGQAADYVIGLNAGEEKSVAATKTYTTELMAVAMLSAMLAEGDAKVKMVSDLVTVPAAVAETLNLNSHIEQLTPRYRYMDRAVVIGRGFNYSTAFELALKLKELTYTTIEPYSSADFLHGPFAMIQRGFPVITIAPSGVILPEMKLFMEKVRSAGGELIAISDDAETLAIAHKQIPLPKPLPEWLSPVTAIVAGQIFAMHSAATRGYNVDEPRGLNKVTETR